VSTTIRRALVDAARGELLREVLRGMHEHHLVRAGVARVRGEDRAGVAHGDVPAEGGGLRERRRESFAP
jgi:hypothetical protein